MAGSFRGGCALAATAAVLGEVAHELVHVLEVGAVDDEAPVLPPAHEAGAGEMREMEGERRRRQVELLTDAAGGEALGAGFDQETVGLQSRFLCEGGERVDDVRHFHISRIMETTAECQARRKTASARPPGPPRRRGRACATARPR